MIEESPKPYMTVLDFVGNSGRHKLISAADILGGNYSQDVIDAAKESAKKSGKAKDVLEALKEEDERIKRELERELLEEQKRIEREKLIAKARYNRISSDPFDLTSMTPEREMKYEAPASEAQRNALIKIGFTRSEVMNATVNDARQMFNEVNWRQTKGLCTVKQARLLKKYKINANVTKAKASQLISELAERYGWNRHERTSSARGAQETSTLFTSQRG